MQVTEVRVPTGSRPTPLSILAQEVLKTTLAPALEAQQRRIGEVFAPMLREVNRSVGCSISHTISYSMARGIRSNPALLNVAKMQADLLEAIRKS